MYLINMMPKNFYLKIHTFFYYVKKGNFHEYLKMKHDFFCEYWKKLRQKPFQWSNMIAKQFYRHKEKFPTTVILYNFPPTWKCCTNDSYLQKSIKIFTESHWIISDRILFIRLTSIASKINVTPKGVYLIPFEDTLDCSRCEFTCP